jgi:hypothetical protein
VSGVFDNVKVQNAVPCISAAPRSVTTARGDNSNVVTVTIPRLLNATQAVNVTVTSADPSVAAPEGAVGGSLTLNFAAGAANSQSFSVVAGGKGLTTFQLANDAGACLDVTSLAITVTSALGVEFSDDFATAIDPAKWDTISTPLNAATPGTATAGSGVTIDNGQVKMAVTAETAEWPGFALTMIDTYSAALLDPVAFEVDRVQLGKVLVTGTSAKQRAGVWVLDANSTNYVFFGEYATWDGTAGGWQYNRVIGQAGDTALPAAGVAIPAFNAARFNDQGNHRIRVLVNGVTAALYLDGVFGAEVPFPVTDNIKFGFGTYVLAATDIATGLFDNAAVLTAVETLGTLAAAVQANGDVVISWEGAGNLQSSAVLGDPQAWSAVSPAPTGNSVTIPAAQLECGGKPAPRVRRRFGSVQGIACVEGVLERSQSAVDADALPAHSKWPRVYGVRRQTRPAGATPLWLPFKAAGTRRGGTWNGVKAPSTLTLCRRTPNGVAGIWSAAANPPRGCDAALASVQESRVCAEGVRGTESKRRRR